MASGRVAQGQHKSITTQSVCFLVTLASMGMALRQENAKTMELGVAKIFFV